MVGRPTLDLETAASIHLLVQRGGRAFLKYDNRPNEPPGPTYSAIHCALKSGH